MTAAEQLQLGAMPEEAEASARPAQRDWTAEQRVAVESDDPYVFVEAGAGTGKTGVLVERYCDAVEAAEAGADSVLAFTFTEKAAGELRGRVRAELRRRAAEAEESGDADRAKRLRELARAPGAWLTTIHGFCRRLLAAHPIAAGVDPGFRVLDAVEADLLAERAFDGAFDELLADPEPARLALAAARGRPILRELVAGAHDELRSLGRAQPELDPLPGPDLSGALDELAAAAAAALAETEAETGSGAEGRRERIAEAATLADAHRTGTIPDLDEVMALRISSKKFGGDAVAAYDRAIDCAVERLAAGLYEALRVLVRLFGERYAELKAERSGLDFEDLQLHAVRLLRESETVREAWRTRFTDLLVDEFQDTNRLQVALIQELRGPATRLFTVGDEFQAIYGFRHADVEVFRAERERGRALPLRGNFRSDPGVLSAANAVGGILLPGYRALVVGSEREGEAGSEPPVEVIVVERGGWEEDDVKLADRDRLDAPAERVAEASSLAMRLADLAAPVAEGGAGIAPGDIVVLLRAFTHVTAYEDALERVGLRPLVVGGRGYWSQQQVEDMRSLLAVVANPLDDEALLGALACPAVAVSPDGLWLLRRASGRGRHMWTTVERLFGDRGQQEEAQEATETDPEREAEEERRREAAEAIPEKDAERLARFHRLLAGLRERAAILPLDALVDATARAFDYDLAVLQKDRGRRRWANVRKLMQLARDYEAAGGRDLAGFLALLRVRAERDDREPEAQTELEGHDGVRVMTVHNAKGLEFPVVAIADLGRDLGSGGFAPAFRARASAVDDGLRVGVRLARAGGPSLRLFELNELHAEASEEESAEDRRLAYVAVTRAERRLILTGVIDPGAVARCAKQDVPPARASVLLRLLNAFGIGIDEEGGLVTAAEPRVPGAGVEIGEDGALARVTLPPAEALPELPAPEPGEMSITLLRPRPEIGTELLAGRVVAAGPVPPAPEGRSPLAAGGPAAERPVAPGQLSNAALDLYARCGYRFYVERLLGLRTPVAEEGEGALAFGSGVHALLEWSARNRWLEPPAERIDAALARAGLDPDPAAIDRAERFVAGWLASPLQDEIASGRGQLAPEAPFLLEVEGAIVRGTLDLLVSRHPGEVPLVVDYKTNALRDREPAELIEHYETQRDLYALATSSALGADQVRTAFVFLERPDDPVVTEHDAGALAKTRERLAELVSGISAGSFDVTDSPHRELCHDCPAQPRLCVHPPERTLADL